MAVRAGEAGTSAASLIAARLWDAFDETRPAGTHLSVWNGSDFDDLTWDGWRTRAERAAVALRRLGVAPGDYVPCVLTNSPETCAAALGIWLAGGVIVSLPTPARGMKPDVYSRQITTICDSLGADRVLLEERFAAALGDEVLPGIEAVSFESLDADGRISPVPPGLNDIAFVQYSSGSTGNPRGCMLTTRAIERQLDILAEGLDLDPAADQGVMWLPLSHDMGFFGCLMLSFAKGMRLVVSSPERFLRTPRTWFGDCARVQATITAAPNFALELAARAARRSPPPARFPMRKCVLGGERVEASTLDAATDALAPYGLEPASLLPAYGLAESVLAVTMTPLADPPNTLAVDGDSLAKGAVCPPDGEAQRLVSAGRPLRGVSLRIDGDDGAVGEICIRSPSLGSGYVDDPAETEARFVAGELRTRDLGFMRDDELYVVGRLDDMLCVAGRNIWARDIEAAISSRGAARPGSAALVDVAGTRLVLLVEPPKGATDHDAVGCESSRVAVEAAGLKPDECLVLPPGTLPKTPSGKIQRFRCRSLAASEAVEPLARVTP